MAENIPWGSDAAHTFVTNVGLITSKGPHGHNVMSAEWTHHVSYEPGYIMVNIRPTDATAENIVETGEFGVNIASTEQNVFASVAGGSSGKKVDKVAALRELEYDFYEAETIDVLMVEGAALNVECRVVEETGLGDHTMFVGEAQKVDAREPEPLAYHNGRYWKMNGDKIQKPPQEELDRIEEIVDKHSKD